MRVRCYGGGCDVDLTRGLGLVVRWNRGLSVRWWDTRRKPWRIRTLWGPAFKPGYALRRRKGA